MVVDNYVVLVAKSGSAQPRPPGWLPDAPFWSWRARLCRAVQRNCAYPQRRLRRNVAACILLLCSLKAFAELTLPYIISDNMVLQREQPVRIWGWADPGAEVIVGFAGQKKTATADDAGKWLITLDPMPASSKGRTLQVSSIRHPASSIQIHNVLIGEVWQAAGQSNMQMSLMGETHWQEAAEFPPNDQIRLFKQGRNPQGKPAADTLKTAWLPDNSVSRRHFSAVAYSFARDLQKALGVPVGISLACEGGTRCQYWTPMETFESRPEYKEWLDQAILARAHFEQIKAKFEADQAEFLRKRKAREEVGRHPTHYGRHPCYYYNGNIHPIRNYTLRGVIWYQGERNSMTTKDAFEYRTYFPLMIESWRRAFRHPDMPFYFVQLPKMALRDPRDSKVTRESQLLTAQNLKNVNMVVTLDVGEPGLHPRTKRPIGERLANVALAEVYDGEVEYRFPLYKRSDVKGATMVIRFEHVGEGLMSNDGEALREFTICGADQHFLPASAEIAGDTVVVSCPEINSPVAVRYAWKNAPMANLFGKNGLPVSPFRTDAFELPEKNPPR
jgi:sialate O-acetylesterase